jgi:ketosteroid isomerase-like protein
MAVALGFVLTAAAFGQEAGIREVLEKQAADWNRGDVRAFVEGYDAEAVFVGETTTRGSAQLLERYRKRYPARANMGHLTFSNLEIQPLGAEHAYVIGRWHLDRAAEAGGPVGGVFTLVFRKTSAGWRIILDHTS